MSDQNNNPPQEDEIQEGEFHDGLPDPFYYHKENKYSNDISTALLALANAYGNRTNLMRWELKQKQKRGDYGPVPLTSESEVPLEDITPEKVEVTVRPIIPLQDVESLFSDYVKAVFGADMAMKLINAYSHTNPTHSAMTRYSMALQGLVGSKTREYHVSQLRRLYHQLPTYKGSSDEYVNALVGDLEASQRNAALAAFDVAAIFSNYYTHEVTYLNARQVVFIMDNYYNYDSSFDPLVRMEKSFYKALGDGATNLWELALAYYHNQKDKVEFVPPTAKPTLKTRAVVDSWKSAFYDLAGFLMDTDAPNAVSILRTFSKPVPTSIDPETRLYAALGSVSYERFKQYRDRKGHQLRDVIKAEYMALFNEGLEVIENVSDDTKDRLKTAFLQSLNTDLSFEQHLTNAVMAVVPHHAGPVAKTIGEPYRKHVQGIQKYAADLPHVLRQEQLIHQYLSDTDYYTKEGKEAIRDKAIFYLNNDNDRCMPTCIRLAIPCVISDHVSQVNAGQDLTRYLVKHGLEEPVDAEQQTTPELGEMARIFHMAVINNGTSQVTVLNAYRSLSAFLHHTTAENISQRVYDALNDTLPSDLFPAIYDRVIKAFKDKLDIVLANLR